MTGIFISHSSKDNAAAESMKAWLEEQGYRSLFLDIDPEDGIEAGTEWKQVLYSRLRQCQAVIALVTPNWLGSKWCFAEVTQADAQGKAVFVVKVQDCDSRSILPNLQHVDLTADMEGGYWRLTDGLKAHGLDPRDSFDWDETRSPYPGLHYFEEEDAAIFFGRDKEIAEALGRLNYLRDKGAAEPRLVVFMGPSGSGKSSLVRAGVLPRLMKDRASWLVLSPFRARKDPLEELAKVLAEGFGAVGKARDWKEILEELRAAAEAKPVDGKVLKTLAGDLQAAAGRREATVLLTIDQAEELLAADSIVTKAFLRVLRAALEVADRQLMVVATMRSDFLTEFQTHPVLEVVQYEAVKVGKMPLDNIPELVEKPARLADVQFEDGLVARLQSDAETPDALPLLAFTLRQLYEIRREKRFIGYAEYEKLGGLEESVAQAAANVLEHSMPNRKELEALRNAFIPRMVRINLEGLYVHRLAFRNEMPQLAESLLKKLVDARLLVSDRGGRGTLEVAHEALLRRWPLLTQWLREDRDNLMIRDGIERAAEDWEQGEKSDDFLVHREGRLSEAKKLVQQKRFALKEDSIEKLYLERCIDSQTWREFNRRRLVRGTIASLSVVLATVSGLAFWALNNASEARRQAEQAQLQNAKVTALTSDALFLSGDDQTGAVFAAIQAMRKVDGIESVEPDVLGEISSALHASSSRLYLRHLTEGHSPGYTVRAIEFSPDGKTIVSASEDSTIKLWDRDGNLLASLDDHSGTVWDLDFSPDGEILASASEDGSVRLWNQNGQPLAILDGNPPGISSVELSPDGETIASSSNDGMVRLWDRTGNPLKTLDGHLAEGGSLEFSPDGEMIASPSNDGKVQLWNRNGQSIATLEGHSGGIFDIEFSPGGETIASASGDGTVRLWKQDGSLLTTLEGGSDVIWDVEFSPDGETIASASGDGTVRLWKQDGSLLATLEGHSATIWDIEFSPDGEIIASASLDGMIMLWRETGTHWITLDGHSSGAWNIEFSPDGETIASTGDNGDVRFWRINSYSLNNFEGHSGGILDIDLSPNGEAIASASRDGTVRLWDRNGNSLAILEGHSDSINSVEFSPDGETIASGSRDGTIRLWDRNGSPLGVLLSGSDYVREVKFSPDGETILSASNDRFGADPRISNLRIWDRNGNLIATFEDRLTSISKVFFSPDSEEIVLARNDGTISLLDRNGNLIINYEGHSSIINELDFSPDGKMFVSASNDGTVRLWDRNGNSMATIEGHSDRVNAVKFSPSGETIASASDDGTVRLWDRNGSPLATLEGHSGTAWAIEYSPNGETLASVSSDDSLKLWRHDGTLLASLEGYSELMNGVLGFSEDGEIVVSGKSDGTLLVWYTNIDRLVAYACRQLWDDIQITDRLEDVDRQFCRDKMELYPNQPWEPLPTPQN